MINVTERGETVIRLAETLTGIFMLDDDQFDIIAPLIASIIGENEENDAPAPAALLTRRPRDDETE